MSETMKRTIQGAEKAAMPLGLILLMLGVFSRVCRYMRWSALAYGESNKAVLFDLEPAKMLWGAALLLLLLSALRRPDSKAFRIDAPLKILLVFVALAVASLMWSYDAQYALPWVIRLYVPVTIYVLVSSYTRTLRDVRAWAYTFIITSFGAFVFATYETLFLIGRMGGFFKHSVGGDQYVGEYCTWSMIGLSAAFYFILHPRKPWERYAGIMVSLAALVTIYITYRRAAVLGVSVVILMYLFTVGRRHRILWVVPLLAAILMVGVLAINPRYAQRLATIPILGGSGGVQSFNERARLEQFNAGLNTVRDHWRYGIGFGATMVYFQQVHRVGQTMPHNIVLHLIGELGIIGFGLFAAFIGSAMIRMRAVYRRRLAEGDEATADLAMSLLASLVAVVFYALFHPIVHDTFFYVLAAVGSCMFSAVLGEPQPADEASPAPGVV